MNSIRYAASKDGVQIAWAESGNGPLLIWAPNNYTSIIEDPANPIRAPLLHELSSHFRVVRYDHRGFGSSSRDITDQTLCAWQADLGAVIDAVQPQGPVAIFGMSQGAAAAIAYAADHPGRVSRLILHGAAPYGPGHARSDAVRTYYNGMIEATAAGWSARNSAFRMWMSAGLLGEATAEEIGWFDEFFARTATSVDAVRYLHGWRSMDARPLLASVAVPTLVTHNSGDELAPASLGREIAAGIPGARYVALDGNNHVPRPQDGTLTALITEMLRFAGRAPASSAVGTLTSREREVLGILSQGKSNVLIAKELGVAEKTVRNHLSAIYSKLGVSHRTEAVVAVLKSHVDLLGEEA